MASPDGKLTPAQFEIMQCIWNSGEGLSVAEIWDAVRGGRDVSRTTVLNLVDRLEKRGWLKRRKLEGVYRYVATVNRDDAESQLASDFVQEFFDGSASNFIMSLLGSKQVSKSEIDHLKRLLADAGNPAPKKGTQK